MLRTPWMPWCAEEAVVRSRPNPEYNFLSLWRDIYARENGVLVVCELRYLCYCLTGSL